MHAGHRQRGKRPDQVVRDEEVWARRPMLGVPVEPLQVFHALLTGHGMPLRECRHGSVMENDELGTPRRERQARRIGGERLRHESLAHDAFPGTHLAAFLKITSTSYRSVLVGVTDIPSAMRSQSLSRYRPTTITSPWRRRTFTCERLKTSPREGSTIAKCDAPRPPSLISTSRARFPLRVVTSVTPSIA